MDKPCQEGTFNIGNQIMNDGNNLRKEKLLARDNQKNKEIDEKSRIIERKVLDLKEVGSAKSIFIYVSFRSEVSTTLLIKQLMKAGKNISVPMTYVREKKMEAISISSIEEDLEPGYCGILEPKNEILVTKRTNPKTIDLVVVPGSVFDERGGRFGYGGGYYDRFLNEIPDAVRIGLAFEIQIVQRAPIKEHDELLDYIVTEKRVINGKIRKTHF